VLEHLDSHQQLPRGAATQLNHNHFVPANGSSVGSSAVPNQGQPTGANTGSTRTHKSAGKVIDLKPKEAVRPHVKVSLEDINWVRSQPPCVQQLWLDCMAVEQFGNQQRELKTSLSSKSFRLARIALQKQKLFDFEPITKLSQSGRTSISSWKVQNLHGYYIKKYWELEVLGGETLPPERENLPASGETLPPERENLPASGETLPPERENLPEEKLKTLDIQGVDFSQPSANHVLTTHQPPTKVVGAVVSIPSEETERPLGGAPTMRDGMPESETPQAAIDCPTASGGESSPNQLTSLGDNAEVTGVELKDLDQDHFSGAVGNIDETPNSDEVKVVSGEECSAEAEVGHFEIVEKVCQLALDHYCPVGDVERSELMDFTQGQLELVSRTFLSQIAKRSKRTKNEIFQFALSLGRRSRPASVQVWRRTSVVELDVLGSDQTAGAKQLPSEKQELNYDESEYLGAPNPEDFELFQDL